MSRILVINPSSNEAVADEIWFMEAGRLIERGGPAELAGGPGDSRLGAFLRNAGMS